jgi:hypothetical protein
MWLSDCEHLITPSEDLKKHSSHLTHSPNAWKPLPKEQLTLPTLEKKIALPSLLREYPLVSNTLL